MLMALSVILAARVAFAALHRLGAIGSCVCAAAFVLCFGDGVVDFGGVAALVGVAIATAAVRRRRVGIEREW